MALPTPRENKIDPCQGLLISGATKILVAKTRENAIQQGLTYQHLDERDIRVPFLECYSKSPCIIFNDKLSTHPEMRLEYLRPDFVVVIDEWEEDGGEGIVSKFVRGKVIFRDVELDKAEKTRIAVKLTCEHKHGSTGNLCGVTIPEH